MQLPAGEVNSLAYPIIAAELAPDRGVPQPFDDFRWIRLELAINIKRGMKERW
jgi:hypothetical protein